MDGVFKVGEQDCEMNIPHKTLKVMKWKIINEIFKEKNIPNNTTFMNWNISI